MQRRMKSLIVGHALDPKTQIGPVVDERQLEQDEFYISIARDQGGAVVGGDRVSGNTRRHFLAPALVTQTTGEMRINRVEVFGPVASVVCVKDYDEALSAANDTRFGLSAGHHARMIRGATRESWRCTVEAKIVKLQFIDEGVYDPHRIVLPM